MIDEELKAYIDGRFDKIGLVLATLDSRLSAIEEQLKPVVYLAGYISSGKNDKGEELIDLCQEWRDWFIEKCPEARFINPMDGEAVENLRKRGLLSDLPARAILEKDRASVRRADIIVANMDMFGGTRPTLGTPIELGWADADHKPILVLAHESDYTQHPFLIGMAAIIDHRKTEVLRVLKAILKGQ